MLRASSENQAQWYFSMLSLISSAGLLSIWALPNTIALRHLFLGLGFISAIFLISKSGFFEKKNLLDYAPLTFLTGIFIWAGLHYALFSLNPELELQELKSIWIRAFLGAVSAVGLCIALRVYQVLRPYFFISIFVISWINLVAYFYLSYQNGGFVLPADFVTMFVFKKIEAGFFGVIAISIACANVMYLMSQRWHKVLSVSIALWFLAMTSAIISSVVANTKNGVAVDLALCVLLGLVLTFKAVVKGGGSKTKTILPIVFIAVLLLASWKVHLQFASQGWSTLIEDIHISSQLEKHNFWRVNGHQWVKITDEEFPKNSRGVSVAGNTYERAAWGTQGLILIAQYPMGYGSINRSYVGMLNHAGIKHELESQTHSGWIDFGLAFGIPGLTILALVFGAIFFLGVKNGGQFGLMGAWLSLGLVPFGVIAEINYKHNFEILIFFIAFAAASVLKGPKQSPVFSGRL